jgi:adenosylhomocysteinase
MSYAVKNTEVYESGQQKIRWVANKMPILNKIAEIYRDQKPCSGYRIAMSIHLEAKTAYLALKLKELGATVYLTGCNPLSTQDDVAAALVKEGINVFAWYDCTEEEYVNNLIKVLECKPHLIIDDGGDLVHLLHTVCPEFAENLIGGCEETTTGVMRLRALAKEKKLKFPMIAVNDAKMKYLFDNRYGTGQSVWDGINRTTNLIVAGKTVVIAGYGWCGKGVAMRAKGFGAHVVITEIDPIKACEAIMDGFDVMPMDQACEIGDLFITVTGCKDVITKRHFSKLKNGAILCNAGHFNVEISVEQLEQAAVSKRQARRNITGYTLENGNEIYLLAEGRLVNLAAGDGHPAEIMDMSFALQALCNLYLLEKGKELQKNVYAVPESIDKNVAFINLESRGKTIDVLDEEQRKYLSSWDL